MKKTLNIEAVTNELRGGSAFFPSYREAQPTPPPVSPHPVLPESLANRSQNLAQSKNHVSTEPRNHGNVEPRNHGTTVSRSLSETPSAEGWEPLDISAKAQVKHTFEFTEGELELLEDIKTNLRREADLRVAKNDIVRLGIHFLAEDYKKRKRESIIVTTLSKKK